MNLKPKIYKAEKTCLVVFLLLNMHFYAQKDTLTFKLVKPQYEIEVLLNDTVFKTYQKNYFQIKTSDAYKVTYVKVLNGKVTMPSPNNYCVTFEKPGETFIKVYAKNIKNQPFLANLTPVSVVEYKLPSIFVSNVKADSAIDKQHLIKTGVVTAYSDQLKQPLKVTSFGLVMGNDTLYVAENRFPIEIKNRFQYMKNGDQLQLYNIKVMFPDEQKTEKIVPLFTVFVVETDQYSVGTRKHIEDLKSSPSEP